MRLRYIHKFKLEEVFDYPFNPEKSLTSWTLSSISTQKKWLMLILISDLKIMQTQERYYPPYGKE